MDTWGWLAIGHRRDPCHEEVKRFYKSLKDGGAVIYTSDYVLDELITILFRRELFEEASRFIEAIFRAVEYGHLRIERITSKRVMSAWQLRKKLQDKPEISFTDITSMTLMRELDIKNILTQDVHFTKVGMGFQRVP